MRLVASESRIQASIRHNTRGSKGSRSKTLVTHMSDTGHDLTSHLPFKRKRASGGERERKKKNANKRELLLTPLICTPHSLHLWVICTRISIYTTSKYQFKKAFFFFNIKLVHPDVFEFASHCPILWHEIVAHLGLHNFLSI